MSKGLHLALAALSYVSALALIANNALLEKEFTRWDIAAFVACLVAWLWNYTHYWFHDRIYRNWR